MRQGLKERDGRQPLVSIVVATNRDSPYLADSLDSVRAQSFRDWELIIVDNGHPNPKVLASLVSDDDRMRVVSIDESAGMGSSRNVGVALTSGNLVTYLDDDDVWSPDRLEKHVAVHAANPTASATYSGYWHMDADGRRFGVDWTSRPSTSRDVMRGVVGTPIGGAFCVRRETFEEIGGFSPEIPILIDFEFALRLAQKGELIYIDEALVGYRRHDKNLTSTRADNARLRRRVMEEMVDRQRWAALGRGDVELAQMFEERLERHRKDEARLGGAALYRLLRQKNFGGAAELAVWAVSRAPGSFLKSAAKAPFEKAARMARNLH